MTVRRATRALAVTASLSLAPGLPAAAQPAAGYGEGFGRFFSALQLTDAQQQQIHQIMQAARTQNAPEVTELRNLREQLRSTLFSSGDVTAASLAGIQQQIETVRQQLDASRLQTALQVRGVLTAAQLSKAASLQSQLASLRQQEHTLLAASGSP